MLLKENCKNGPIIHPTYFSVTKKDDLFIFSFEAMKSSLFSAHNKYNDPIYEGCVVEVFIEYGKKNHYYEVEVAPNGTVFLADIENIDGKTHIFCIDDCSVKSNVKIDVDCYNVTIQIPVEKIKTESPKFNAFRIEVADGKQYLYALNPTMCDWFHRMEFFIDLLPLL